MRIAIAFLDSPLLGLRQGSLWGTVQAAMLGRVPYPVLRDGIFAHPTMTEGLKYLFAGVPESAGYEAEEDEIAHVRG